MLVKALRDENQDTVLCRDAPDLDLGGVSCVYLAPRILREVGAAESGSIAVDDELWQLLGNLPS